MNWVLILVMGYNTGATSEQIGPFASLSDCEKSYAIAEIQDDKTSPRIRHHFCVPKPYNRVDNGFDSAKNLPEELN